jgi:hypothetical protein
MEAYPTYTSRSAAVNGQVLPKAMQAIVRGSGRPDTGDHSEREVPGLKHTEIGVESPGRKSYAAIVLLFLHLFGPIDHRLAKPIAPLMSEFFLCGEHWQANGGPPQGPGGESSSPVALSAGGLGVQRGSAFGVASASTTLRLRALGLALGIGVVLLGSTLSAWGRAARKETACPHCPQAPDLALRSESCVPPSGEVRQRSATTRPWHKKCHRIARVTGNDPSDDGTSRDPDDDDDSADDLNGDDPTEMEFTLCLCPVLLYRIAEQTASAPFSSETHSALFLTLQRLRC